MPGRKQMLEPPTSWPGLEVLEEPRIGASLCCVVAGSDWDPKILDVLNAQELQSSLSAQVEMG
jgi:hypothetical protein